MYIPFKNFLSKKRVQNGFTLVNDFIKKCNDDHVSAFGAMSAFFILLSLFPFMIFLLTLAKYLPFSKEDIQHILTEFIAFEKNSIIIGVINEIYRKTSTSVFTLSIFTVLWASSKGIFSIVKGLNSVYDIDDQRNYFVLRCFSLVYTVLFALILVVMLILWVFGNQLYQYICQSLPLFGTIAAKFIHKRLLLTFLILAVIFVLIYHFIPARKSSLLRQIPGAVVASLGWMVTSKLCAFYMDHFGNFTYMYGSMAGILILLIWLYFCMSMVFYGAEVNYFLENKDNYHMLIQIIRPNYRKQLREKENEMKKEKKEGTKNVHHH